MKMILHQQNRLNKMMKRKEINKINNLKLIMKKHTKISLPIKLKKLNYKLKMNLRKVNLQKIKHSSLQQN